MSASAMKGHPLSVNTEDRLGLLIDAVEEYAIFMLDPDGRVASWNAGARRIKGYPSSEILGRHFSVFYTEEDRLAGKPQHELEEATERGVYREEGWRVRQDGTRFWANVTITAIRDADGELQGFAKVTRDETDRKRAAEQARLVERLRDRDRVADDLRDSVVHQIFKAGLALQSALRLIRDPEATKRVTEGIDALDQTLRHIRSVVVDLNTPDQ